MRVCGTRTGADRLRVSCSSPRLSLEKLGWMCEWDSGCHRLRVPPPPAPSDPSAAPEEWGWTHPPSLLRLTGNGHSHDPSGFPGLRMERMVLTLFENPPTIRLNPTHFCLPRNLVSPSTVPLKHTCAHRHQCARDGTRCSCRWGLQDC